MKRNIIVERSVHSARAQTVRYGKQHKLPERRGKRKQKQRRGGEKSARRCDNPRAETLCQPVAEQAGNYGARADYERNDTGKTYRRTELLAHHRPRRAEERIRQAEAYETKIDYRYKKGKHTAPCN